MTMIELSTIMPTLRISPAREMMLMLMPMRKRASIEVRRETMMVGMMSREKRKLRMKSRITMLARMMPA